MGSRGPAPTPTAKLRLSGSWRAKTRTNEPEPDRARPTCPAWLRPEAKACWKRIVPQLEAMGVLGRIDRNALARYCELWARWRECAEFVQKHGETYPMKSKDGRVIGLASFPQAKAMQSLSETLRKLEAEFGMTPAGRARLAIDMAEAKKPKGEGNGKASFFAS